MARQRISGVEEEIRRKTSPVDVVVAKRSIASGDVMTTENLARHALASSGTTARNVPAKEYDLLLGARSKVSLSAGEPVLWTDVEDPLDTETFSRTIPAGRRALTVEADPAASFGGLLRPGDRVDLFCSGPSGSQAPLWFYDLPVIAVDRRFGPSPDSTENLEASAITLSVTPDEARRLSAVRNGSTRWFLRNPEDRGRPPVARDNRQALLSVEIWKGGIRRWPPPSATAAVGFE